MSVALEMVLEEYGSEIIYIKGIHNTVADAISRLEMVPQNIKKAAKLDDPNKILVQKGMFA
jgi:hypothetical protein